MWLVIAAHTLQKAKAEITCASCPSPLQLHLEELQLGMRTDPTGEPATLHNLRVEFRELGVTDQNTGEDDDGHETVVSVEDAPQFPQDVSLDGVSAKEDAPGTSEESRRGGVEAGEPEKGEDAAPRRARRSGPEFAEFSESGWTGRTGMDGGAPEDRGSLLDGHRQGRSDFRWNKDEGRGNNRQDEPKLTSSTFALTGDSAHNHAVVYWSGQNSSVSHPELLCLLCILCRFFAAPHLTGGTNSVAHRAGTGCALWCRGSLLTGALEATDAHRRTLLPKCQTRAATVNFIRWRPLTLPAIAHEAPSLLEHLFCCLVTLSPHPHLSVACAWAGSRAF